MVVAYDFNPSTREFHASLVYKASSRTARAVTHKKTLSPKKKEKKRIALLEEREEPKMPKDTLSMGDPMPVC